MFSKFALAAAALVVSGSAAMAADLYVPEAAAPIIEATGSSFEGFYAGAQLGGVFYSDDYVDTDASISVGGFVGYNFAADPLLLGVELQGNYYFDNDDGVDAYGDLLALGKVGFVVGPNVALYATGGVGYVWTDGEDFAQYALGVGAEMKVTDDMSIRGEILGINYDDAIDNDDMFESARATVGVLWHF
jgi:outer membrane immunogenic protein